MPLITWRSEYRVGVAQVDAEHRYLFSLINAFHDAYAGGQSTKDLLTVLTRLVAYAETHFQHEEALMTQRQYPRLAHHHEQHERLYAAIYQLNEKLAANTLSVDRETMRFLKHWLVDHILQEDLGVGEFFRTRAVRAVAEAKAVGAAVQTPAEPAGPA